MEMQALIEEITALLGKIKSGEANQADLEAFVAATNQLNERAIVLRYKAYEASVFGTTRQMPLEEQASELTVKVDETPVVEQIVEGPIEEPAFDLFALNEEEEPELSFDLEEPVAEVPVEKSIQEVEESIIEPEITPTVEENAFTSIAEPQQETSQQASISQNLNPIYEKINQNDGSLAARLMSVRLDTLKGAFGFNERLQITQELFGGSNEAFNLFIETIETTPTREEARSLVSQTADKYQWNIDSQLALELVQKIERKYA